MVDVTSVDRARIEFGDIVVIGGGCYGSYYVRQLARAAAADAVAWSRLLVVDRDAGCRVAGELCNGAVDGHPMAQAQVVASEWADFIDEWVPVAEVGAPDAIVPSPLMPHLLVEFLERRAAARWPARTIGRRAPGSPVGTPWERSSPDGTAYVSHATWMCPVNCIEPRICPHTRDVRDWTMPRSIVDWVQARRAAGDALLGPFTFQCTHRAYGVGMVDKQPIRDADEQIALAGEGGAATAVVATTSHCHGALSLLDVSAPG